MEIEPKVKAWAVFDKDGFMFAESTKPDSQLYMGSGRTALAKDVQIVSVYVEPTPETLLEHLFGENGIMTKTAPNKRL